jgi:hypothetical protein
MRIRALILLPFLLGLSFFAVTAQTSTTLQPGVPVERDLRPRQVHEFTVTTKESSFVQLVVEQEGIDVVVKIASPDGKALRECDTPNGDEGKERVSFLAKDAGRYSISISPLDTDGATSGKYQIKLVEVRPATEEEIEAAKNRETAKARGIALLLDLRDAIAQIKSPNTRINAQLTAANLLREHDEKSAAKYLSDAVADLTAVLASADGEDDAEDRMSQFATVAQLRNEVIRVLAETDPDAALSFLQSTTPKYSPYGNPRELVNQESALELSIVDQIARKDPNRALQLARQNLEKAYSPSLLNTASQLAEKNPEMATELVHDIASKILGEEKLISNVEAANLAMALLTYRTVSEKRSEVVVADAGSIPPQFAMMQQQKLRPGMLSEQEYKQLVQKMVREVVSYTQSNNRSFSGGDALWVVMSGLRSLGAELDKVVGGSAAALEKKQTELIGNVNNQWVNQFQEYSNAIANSPVEGAMEAIEKAPVEFREQLYMMLATKEAGGGDLNRARQILNEHVSNPYQRSQALKSIEQQELDQAMSSGKIEEALRNIGALRKPGERAEHLLQLAGQIGSDQKRATALSLLDQARSLLPLSPQAQDQTQMSALLEIARAYTPYDSKRSFEMVDPLIDQLNDLCSAARTLEGFGFVYFDHDELDMRGEGALSELAGQMSEVLSSLALINFDRAKAMSDKLRLPEVRLHVHLRIAEQAITGKE